MPEVAWIAWATVSRVRLVSEAMLKMDFHCRPTSSALLASTSATTDSTTSCARRVSSSSIVARSSRYSGSGAVTISALDAGSAWMKPPIDGAAMPAIGVVVSAEAVLLLGEPEVAGGDARLLVGPLAPVVPEPPLPPTLLASLANAARSTVASRTASVYLR